MKKGFTLIELLAVIIVLAVIALIAVPRIMDAIDDARRGAYNQNEYALVKAAKTHLVENNDLIPTENNMVTIVTLEQLIDSDNIKAMSMGAEECDGYVTVVLNDDNIEYHPNIKCGNEYTTPGYLEQDDFDAEIIVIAGGGGGGAVSGGGGGAGGVIHESILLTISSEYDLTVGHGGAGGTDRYTKGENGEDSRFDTFEALGGGGGGSISSRTGEDGGSGGGANSRPSASGGIALLSGAQGTDAGQANGVEATGAGSGSGGGGFSTEGEDTIDQWSAGNGGNGFDATSLIGTTFGDNGWFAAGGGGGVSNASGNPYTATAGLGGQGGGGQGNISMSDGYDALPNTGSGGGGGGYNGSGWTGGNGGSGADGIIFVKYLGSPKAIGGQIYSFENYTIHVFTNPGDYLLRTIDF